MKTANLVLKFCVLLVGLSSCLIKQNDPFVAEEPKTQGQGRLSAWSEIKLDKSLLTFQQVKDQVIVPKCLKCHKSYSVYENVFDLKNQIYIRSILKQDMPKPNSKIRLTDFEGNLLKQWVEIGAPLDASETSNPDPQAKNPPTSGSAFERPVIWETIKTKILDKHCASCHGKDNPDQLTVYEDYKTVSKTIGTIFGLTSIKPVMPPPPENLDENAVNPNQLSTAEKDLIAAWINDGLLEKK